MRNFLNLLNLEDRITSIKPKFRCLKSNQSEFKNKTSSCDKREPFKQLKRLKKYFPH